MNEGVCPLDMDDDDGDGDDDDSGPAMMVMMVVVLGGSMLFSVIFLGESPFISRRAMASKFIQFECRIPRPKCV